MDSILDLSKVKYGESYSSAIVYIKSVEILPKTNGELYVSGEFQLKNKRIPFKIWDSVIVNFFQNNDMIGQIVAVDINITEYKGAVDSKVTAVKKSYTGTFNENDFIETLDTDKNFASFVDFVNNNLSESYIKVINILFSNPLVFERFQLEFAAKGIHDNLRGGVCNHTMKMLRLAKTLVENDPKLECVKDILYLGVIIHDIGKVVELRDGVYTRNSFVSHRHYAVELFVINKAEIVAQVGENVFYRLISIINGHHGEFEEPPKTIWAYIIHLIDMLESNTTAITQSVDFSSVWDTEGAEQTFKSNGRYLTV